MNVLEIDDRVERGDALSMALLKTFLAPLMIWAVFCYSKGATILTASALLTFVIFGIALYLHKLDRDSSAKFLWTCGGIVWLMVLKDMVPSFGGKTYLLIAVTGIPFLIFQRRSEKKFAYGISLVPWLIWLFGHFYGAVWTGPKELSDTLTRDAIRPVTVTLSFGFVIFQ
jgi:hypothetical protein